MNEKIKELMIECGYAAPELAGRAKMLADMIIKECIECSEKVGRFNTSPIEPIHTAKAISAGIRKKFGIE